MVPKECLPKLQESLPFWDSLLRFPCNTTPEEGKAFAVYMGRCRGWGAKAPRLFMNKYLCKSLQPKLQKLSQGLPQAHTMIRFL